MRKTTRTKPSGARCCATLSAAHRSRSKDVYSMDDTVNIVADVRDKKFNAVGDAHATARVTKPSGATVDVPLKFTTLNNENIYTGEFKADELGQHQIELVGTSASL